MQFGGLTGGTAGDATLYGVHGHNLTSAFVDVGRAKGLRTQRLKAATQKVLGNRDETVLDEA